MAGPLIVAAVALTAMAVLVRPHPLAAFGALLLAAVVWAPDPVRHLLRAVPHTSCKLFCLPAVPLGVVGGSRTAARSTGLHNMLHRQASALHI